VLARRILSVGLVGVVAFSGACKAKESKQTATQKEVAAKTKNLGQLTDDTVERTLTVKVAGDHAIDYKAPTKMRFVLRPGTGEAADFSVASVTVPAPIVIDSNLRINPEIGLAGVFKGDGDYTLPAGVGQPPRNGPTAPAVSGASGISVGQVTFITLTPKPSDVRYGYVLEPCKVSLRSNAREGSAECPALLDIDGGRVSMSLTWGA
jgi:hypothetical protein